MRVISDDILATLTIWCEARSETHPGKVAVAEVILNRLRAGKWGNTVSDVVFAPYQFSCWNTKDPNRLLALKLMDTDPDFQDCAKAWAEAQAGSRLVPGAMLYFNPAVVVPAPDWAVPSHLVAKIGNHAFYR